MARFLVLLVLLASTIAACGQDDDQADSAGGGSAASATSSREAVARLKEQANQLLSGSEEAFRARLAELRGTPVVVNQWASWCGPCRFEFPFFQKLARKYQGRVAFLGVNAKDNRDDAAAFLEKYPVPYPHYVDDDLSVSRVFRGGRAFPTTAYYNAAGELVYTHAGALPSEAKLDEEIRKYALDG
jgi:cytochrome c biogenesis protein CcmG/thiol:disulfide interchange protein DsbE